MPVKRKSLSVKNHKMERRKAVRIEYETCWDRDCTEEMVLFGTFNDISVLLK